MRNFVLTPIALLFAVAGTPALGQGFVRDPLMKLIEVRCDDAAKDSIRIDELIQTVVKESLEKFNQVNPRVGEALRSQLVSRRILVTCNPEALDRKGSHADSFDNPFGAFRIRLGFTGAGVTGTTQQKNTVLHELLHYAKIDNFYGRAHSQAEEWGIIAEDNVYACADVIYPDYFARNAVAALAAEETCEKALSDEEDEDSDEEAVE